MPHSSKSPAPTKRHTKPCMYFQVGQCPLDAEECDFAHVHDPTYALEDNLPRSKYRTKPCRYYLAGSCNQAIWCRFKHPVDPRAEFQSAEGTSRPWTVQEMEELDPDSLDVRDVHPEWERRLEQHPKYRTRPCRDHLMGKCNFGASCSYLHPDTDGESVAPSFTDSRRLPRPSTAIGSSPATSPTAFTVSYSGSDRSSSVDDHDAPKTPVERFRSLSLQDDRLEVNAIHHPTSAPYYAVPAAAFYVLQPTYPLPPMPSVDEMPAYHKAPVRLPENASRAAVDHAPRASLKTQQLQAKFAQRPPGSTRTSAPKVSRIASSKPACGELPDKPISTAEEQHRRGFFPINWRVISGGVKIGALEDTKAARRSIRRRQGRYQNNDTLYEEYEDETTLFEQSPTSTVMSPTSNCYRSRETDRHGGVRHSDRYAQASVLIRAKSTPPTPHLEHANALKFAAELP